MGYAARTRPPESEFELLLHPPVAARSMQTRKGTQEMLRQVLVLEGISITFHMAIHILVPSLKNISNNGCLVAFPPCWVAGHPPCRALVSLLPHSLRSTSLVFRERPWCFFFSRTKLNQTRPTVPSYFFSKCVNPTSYIRSSEKKYEVNSYKCGVQKLHKSS